MSVFTDTQGTPERVHALMKLIAAVGGSVSRKTAADLLDPKFAQGRTDEQERSDFTQTLRAARSLRLIDEAGGMLSNMSIVAQASYLEFGDLVHALLVAAEPSDPNGTVLDAFAFFTERIEFYGDGQWLATTSNDTLADQIRDLLASRRPDVGTFNTTRIAPLSKWTDAIGLTAGVGSRQRSFPEVTRRLARELGSVPNEARVGGMPAHAFVAWVLERMPYMPGGNRFVSLFGLSGNASAGRLSIVLSAALRGLHDDGIIKLEVLGDASGAARLAEDRFNTLVAFNKVRVMASGAV